MNENNEMRPENEEEAEGIEAAERESAGSEGSGGGPVQAATSFGMMRYVHAIFFGGAIALAWLFIQIVDTAWGRLYNVFGAMPTPSDPLTILIGAICGFGVAFYLWRHPRVNRLAIEIVTELSKVSWPTRKELSASTVVVIVVSIIASIILGVFDMVWAKITDLMLKI
jgi:preprotein translocase subunit SecE